MAGTASVKRSGMSDERRRRLRLEISREAARLFWAQGVDATSGDQIAAAVGLSTRTVWRHFRTKESCAEPIVMQGIKWGLTTLRTWPRELSLEEHLAVTTTSYVRETTEAERHDDGLAVKMIELADREPAIRTAWLMACDELEREMVEIFAERLRLPADGMQVRMYAAAASAVLRVINEVVGAAVLAGEDLTQYADVSDLIARAIRDSTGGVVGDPVPA
ncbi:Transcriptional regulator, TetR family [Streptomyces sp. YIM 130001]|uniref:TetR/AcrR family transcriptional regulator n=1 Tax=Streptomyces sp. YIM 130001 TaxID=2259644 RepID=UPI000EC3F318|nr:TetR/AcrR family transcriptional regulator [Streptomyces sp. YIM 130001]RII15006.1 Transcriptional regulator, TetR family [Streptomyces sp. YIM 130001]